MSDWTLTDIANATVRRSDLECPAEEREQLDERLRLAVSVCRDLLPADHWYIQSINRVIGSGTRALIILNDVSLQYKDALSPVTEILYTSSEEIDIADKTHHMDGQPLQTRTATVTEVRHLALKKPVEWLKTFMVVKSLETTTVDGIVKKLTKPFDLDGIDSRSQYQKRCYGGFLERWANDDPHVPETRLVVRKNKIVIKPKLPTDKHYIGRTKPRQVGSTTFGKKFSVLCGVNIDGWATLLHFPEASDGRAHLRDVCDDLERLNKRWPQYYPPIVIRNLADGYVELANGSCWQTRHGDTKGGGVSKVGRNWNLVILSEAGKYERKGGATVWNHINQAILPAVHPSTRNAIIWEGTNDEQAHELNRIALKEYVDFAFYGWDCLPAYVGRPIQPADQQLSPAGNYADFRIDDTGEPQPVSERDYVKSHRLTPEQCGFRRRKIDELESLVLVHREFPLTYEESMGLVAGGFFTKIQKTRPPDIISSINWVTATSESVYEKVTETPSLRGLWHRWDLPPLPVGEDPVYALAGDFSDGVPDGDLTLLGVARVNDARLCAAARFRAYPEDIADEMARAVAFFGQERTWVAGELNNVGKAVLVAWRKYGHGLNYTQERKTRAYIDDTEMMWFLQTVSTRTPALLAFREAYQKDKLLIPDERFEWDAEGFIKHENGKYAAMESKSERTGEKYRDDYVMMGAILNELITWLKSRGVGVMDSTSIIITPQDDTMIKQMSGPMQKILRRHMEVRR